jgi:hypothetical protein
MKLSEAIRIGATKRPQAVDDFAVEYPNQPGQICTCALGAAYEGITGQVPPLSYTAKQEAEIRMTIIAATGVTLNTYCQVMEFNDYEHYTREAIAAWLEGQGL